LEDVMVNVFLALLLLVSGVASAAFEDLEHFKASAASDAEDLVRSGMAEFFTLAKLEQPQAVRIEAKPDVVRVGKDLHLRSIVVDVTLVTDHPASVVREARLHAVRDLMTRGYRLTDEPESGDESKPYLVLRVDAEVPAVAANAWRSHLKDIGVLSAMALATMCGFAMAVLLLLRAFVAKPRAVRARRTSAARHERGVSASGLAVGLAGDVGRDMGPEVGLPAPPQVLPQVALPAMPSALVPMPSMTEALAAGRLPEVPDGAVASERLTGALVAGAPMAGASVRAGATPSTDWLVGATRRGPQEERAGATPVGVSGPELLATSQDLLLATFERLPFEKALSLLAGLDGATRRALLERLELTAPVRQRIERALAETYGI
jgi:hypothetical protein